MNKKIEKSNNFKATIKRIIKMLFTDYTKSMIVIFLFAILSTIFAIIGPKILGTATTELFEGLVRKYTAKGSIDFSKIGKILLMVLTLYVVSSIFSLIQGFLMGTISQKMSYNLRKQINEKINKMPMGYFEQRTVGEVLSRITNDVDTFGQGINQSFTQLITSITTILGILVMMISISPTLTLIALLVLPVSGILMKFLTKLSQKYFVDAQKSLADVNGQVEESYAGQSIITVFNHQEKSILEFNEKNSKLFNSSWKSQFL